jgi:hypothetical protein
VTHRDPAVMNAQMTLQPHRGAQWRFNKLTLPPPPGDKPLNRLPPPLQKHPNKEDDPAPAPASNEADMLLLPDAGE